MKINFRHIFAIGLILFISASTCVQAQKVVLSLDTSSIRIGERVLLRLNATLPKSASIYWPAISDTLTSKVEVASKSKIDTNATSRNEFTNYSQTILITSFDTGYHFIPPFTIHYSYAGDSSRHELLSEGVYLKVRTVEVDTTKAIRDIRGPIQAPLTFAEMAPFFAGTAVIVLIISLIWYYLWRKRMNKPLFPVITRTQGPPWQIALQSLDSLEDKKLWQNGKIKEYYSELTDIIRHYLHEQHGIEAMEMITTEILAAYDSTGLKGDARSVLTNILMQADYVKFAKAIPLRNENELSMTYSRQFIDTTKPVITTPEPKPTENNTLQAPDPEVKA
ncbi:MAG: hypothetical protein Q7U54_18810 [Bacteroidales bacterium]|nr:hypothetical protein [Bacteroidales bacterium]